ncbi:MAG: lysophospholipid acyltransferase family protein [candidate division Zixibacteria bacterium]|nr:lysophospholipid acyltransferase family protein [candidate division Zixibacteria bacterium]
MTDGEENVTMSRLKARPIKKRIKNWFLFRLITTIISLLNFLPRNAAISVGGFLGKLAYFLIGEARRKTLYNLSLAFGKVMNGKKLRKLAYQVFENVGKNVADAVRLKKMSWEDIEKITEIEGLEHFDKAYRAEKGVIGFTGHISNFELMAAYFSLRGYKLSVVGREVYDPRLDRLLVENRESVGIENIPSSAGVKPILKVLRAGKFLGVLADQDSSRVRGVFVNFFGRPARTPVGPVLLAYKTGSPIVPMAIVRKNKNKYKIIVKPPVELTFSENREKDITNVTQKCMQVLESIIREHPDQWLWMHDRWKSKPE